MKYYTNLLRGYGLALLSAALLFSCSQVDTFESADLLSEENEAALSDFNLAPFAMGMENARMYSDDACSDPNSCITDQESTWFVRSYEHVYDPVAPAKKLKVDVYNTPTQLIYKINTENTTIKFLQINGVLVINNVVSTSYTHTINLGEFGEDWYACDTESATIVGSRNNLSGGGSGNTGTINTSYKLVGVCQDNCVESFNYIMNVDGSYTFTFIPSEDIADANLVFTFPQGVVVEGLDNWSSNGVTKQLKRDLQACETYSWTVSLDTDCKGSGQPNANLWTDFKVGEDSKKGRLSNIVKSCS